MVYHLSPEEIHSVQVRVGFLDVSDDRAFDGLAYEQDADSLDLDVLEREDLSRGLGAMGHGYRVVGDNTPKKLWWRGGKQVLPDIIGYRFLAVAPRFRDLVEQAEPGLHQFFPVDIYKAKDGEPVATYFWLNVCARLDAVDEDRSTFKKGVDHTGAPFRSWAVPNRKAVFDPAKALGHHLWVNPQTYLSGPLCSDAFAEAALAANFSGLSLTRQEVVQISQAASAGSDPRT